ncbi:hypothetical protein V5O48_017040, partial [Marasmius crinis-equi]
MTRRSRVFKATLCSITLSALVSGSLSVASRVARAPNSKLSVVLGVLAGCLVILGGLVTVYAAYLDRHSTSTLNDSVEMGPAQSNQARDAD